MRAILVVTLIFTGCTFLTGVEPGAHCLVPLPALTAPPGSSIEAYMTVPCDDIPKGVQRDTMPMR